MYLNVTKNAISHDLGFSLRVFPKTRVRKMDKCDIGIKNKGREGARAQKPNDGGGP